MNKTNCCTGDCNQGRNCPLRSTDLQPAAPEFRALDNLSGTTVRPSMAVQHPDDLAVDKFAEAMKAKMAASRIKGRGGWDDPNKCSVDDLRSLLNLHMTKGDPVDVGNFAMMLWIRRATTAAAERA